MENIFGVDVEGIVFEVFESIGLPPVEAQWEARKFLNDLDPTFKKAANENDARQAAIERLNLHLAYRNL